MTIKPGKQFSSSKKRIRDVNELKQWMMDVQHLLQQTVIDDARISEWRKRQRASICAKDG